MKHCMALRISTNTKVAQKARTQNGKNISKKEQLVQLLSNPKGARALSLCKTLGWQKHTVRAAVSGLRADGYVIKTHPSSKYGVTVCRVTGRPDKVAAT